MDETYLHVYTMSWVQGIGVLVTGVCSYGVLIIDGRILNQVTKTRWNGARPRYHRYGRRENYISVQKPDFWRLGGEGGGVLDGRGARKTSRS